MKINLSSKIKQNEEGIPRMLYSSFNDALN